MRTFHVLSLAILMSVTATAVLAKGQEYPGTHKRYCQKHLKANADMLRAHFDALDANHDGLLTRKESGLNNASRRCFYRLDRDHDRRLSVSELS